MEVGAEGSRGSTRRDRGGARSIVLEIGFFADKDFFIVHSTPDHRVDRRGQRKEPDLPDPGFFFSPVSAAGKQVSFVF